jgi:dTDP-glucose 4,6-dehydratase
LRILVTGGMGFIGSNYILKARKLGWGEIINLDKLTYASHPQTLVTLADDPGYRFYRGDIGDTEFVRQILEREQPDAIAHFAAESHVDRSIFSPDDFIQTNIIGAFKLLEASRAYGQQKPMFRFLHVSTDEVYGSLSPTDPAFREEAPYAPNSPYAASKASADHLVRSYHQTYGLPTLTTNCSNNYGPRQFPEKLIPLVLLNALEGKALPIYGDGQNIRDWLYVEDHCDALQLVLEQGKIGETYNVGGNQELTNLAVVEKICSILDEWVPQKESYASLITFVKDRLGHDRRYAINTQKIQTELGWVPKTSFDNGLRKTIQWYLDHSDWVETVRSGHYQTWIQQNYSDR